MTGGVKAVRDSAWIAVVVAATPGPALAQNDTARTLLNLARSAVDRAQIRKSPVDPLDQSTAPELFIPLRYESGAGAPNPVNRADPRNLDVAGVRIGMTPSQAASALRSAGYSDTGTESDQPSYESDIKAEWSLSSDMPYPKPTFVPKNRYWQKGKQRVTVTFLALPGGPVANEIAYTTEDDILSSEAFAAQVRSKYGSPVNEDPTDMRWCTVKAPECEDPRSAELPILSAWTGNRSIRLVGNDPARDEALSARREADIASRKPPETQAAF